MNKFEEIIKRLETPDTIKLSEVSPLESFSEESREVIEGFVNHHDPCLIRIGTLLNSIFTHRNRAFILSFRLMNSLVKADKRNKSNTCSADAYKRMMFKLLTYGILECLRKPTGRKAGVYSLIESSYLDILYKEHGEEYYSAQENMVLEMYDKGSKVKRDKEVDKKVSNYLEFVEESERKVNGKRIFS